MTVADEYAWLIEHGDSPTFKPMYWAGLKSVAFTNKHLAAIRFARKEDAEQVAKGILEDTPTRVCEHGWN